MIRRSLFVLALAGALLYLAAPALGAPAPAWTITSLAAPTNFMPSDPDPEHDYTYAVEATNIGAGATDGTPVTVTDTLPSGLRVTEIELTRKSGNAFPNLAAEACEEQTVGVIVTITCIFDEALTGAEHPAIFSTGERMLLLIHVEPPTTVGVLRNEASVSGGGARSDSVAAENPASASPPTPGLSEFSAQIVGENGAEFNTAAGHPYSFTTTFAMRTQFAPPGSLASLLGVGGDPKDIAVALPPGLVGNPIATERCTAEQFTTTKVISRVFVNFCPPGSAVGVIAVRQIEGRTNGNTSLGAIYNLVPPPGMPAQLGFQVFGAPIYIDTAVRSDDDYGITATLRNTSQAKRITAATVTLWGVPGSPSHDALRGECGEVGGLCPSAGTPLPFLRLPSSCAVQTPFDFALDTWGEPGIFRSASASLSRLSSCEGPPFTPTLTARPTSTTADSPTGLHVDLHVPQAEGVAEPGTADLRDAVVTLPEGLLVNPASAAGLAGCTPAQVGLKTPVGQVPPRFTATPAACPDASKIGTVEVDTPLVDHPLPGAVYLATQGENPFGSLLAIYITVFDPQTGVVVKLPGKVNPDPLTGQLSTIVRQSPQLPFEDFKLDFFEGARAPLRTPAICGTATTTTSLTPWSAPEGLIATPSDTFDISSSPSPGRCPTSSGEQPNAPTFEAGTREPLAGAFSPFILNLSRTDGSQEFKGLNVALPAGLLGKLAGISYCSDEALAAAAASSGAQQQASSSCPAASQVGTVTVGAGAGPKPFYVRGSAYLAGPYKGAPLSVAIITPAVAGPFDLGTVVVRAALLVDPETARVSVKSDPIPTILQGIPLDVRSIEVRMDRPGFTLNPTSCAEKSVAGEEISIQGAVATLNNRFQVGGCEGLAFKPKLQLRLKGATKRIGHPALKATLTYPRGGGYANVARAQVNLPHGEFLDQGNLNKTCTKPVLLAGTCPPSTVYGKAKAWTPLLDNPLKGNVYLVGGYGYKLPALVAELNGQIRVLLVGKVDSGKNKGIRNTFEVVPDAPVEKFVLEMKGGKKYGLLENSENLCKASKAKRRAIVHFTGQNGRVRQFKPVVANQCGKKKGKKSHAKHKRDSGKKH